MAVQTVADIIAQQQAGLLISVVGCYLAAFLIYRIPVPDKWPPRKPKKEVVNDRDRLFGRDVTGDRDADPQEPDDPQR
jgi:hypothetical protein